MADLEAAPHAKEKKPLQGGNHDNGTGNIGTLRMGLAMVDLHHRDTLQAVTRLRRHPEEALAIDLPMEGTMEVAESLLQHPVQAVRCQMARKPN